MTDYFTCDNPDTMPGNVDECWAPERKFISRKKYSGYRRRLNFDNIEEDSTLNYRIKVYDKNSKEIIKDCVVPKKFNKVQGCNQLHIEYVELLPCGQLRKECLEDSYDDFHDYLYHDEECTGVEHYTTCCNPADPLMAVWSRRCSKRCPTLQDTVQKVRKK